MGVNVPTGAVAVLKVTALDHEGRNDAVERRAFVPKQGPAFLRLSLFTRAQSPEILGRFGDGIRKKFHRDAAGGFSPNGNVKEDLGVGAFVGEHPFLVVVHGKFVEETAERGFFHGDRGFELVFHGLQLHPDFFVLKVRFGGGQQVLLAFFQETEVHPSHAWCVEWGGWVSLGRLIDRFGWVGWVGVLKEKGGKGEDCLPRR